jgi:hypothetical protein
MSGSWISRRKARELLESLPENDEAALGCEVTIPAGGSDFVDFAVAADQTTEARIEIEVSTSSDNSYRREIVLRTAREGNGAPSEPSRISDEMRRVEDSPLDWASVTFASQGDEDIRLSLTGHPTERTTWRTTIVPVQVLE